MTASSWVLMWPLVKRIGLNDMGHVYSFYEGKLTLEDNCDFETYSDKYEWLGYLWCNTDHQHDEDYKDYEDVS